MSNLSLRPRIRWLTPLGVDEVKTRLRESLDDNAGTVNGVIIRHHIIVNFPVERQHFWSPRLEVDLLKHERGVLVSGLIGPKPSVWAMVMFVYAFLAFISLFGLVSGLSDLSLGHAPYALIAPAIGLAGSLLMYGGVQTGKRLSQDEVLILRSFLADAVGAIEEVPADEDYEYFEH